VAQANPFVGTWKLNLAKSRFNPGPGPKSQTRNWAAGGKVTVNGVNAAGEAVTYAYVVNGDGKSYKTSGAVPNAADALSSKRIDAKILEAHFTRGGKASDTTRFTVSADGKVLTITAKGSTPGGKPLDDVLVLDRQ